MPIILATYVPQGNLGILNELCAALYVKIEDRLSVAQKKYVESFGPQVLRAKASRLIARCQALAHAEPGAILDMDEKGRSFFAYSRKQLLSFSHTGETTFCLVAKNGENNVMAIDAEQMRNANISGMASFFKKLFPLSFTPLLDSLDAREILKLWLMYECAFKIHGEKFLLEKLNNAGMKLPERGRDKNRIDKFFSDVFSLRCLFHNYAGCIICAAGSENIGACQIRMMNFAEANQF